MRYCGNCGASLDPDALASGRCPSCGARISPAGDVVAPGAVNRAVDGATDISRQPTRLAPGPPIIDLPTSPLSWPLSWPWSGRGDTRDAAGLAPRRRGAGARAARPLLAAATLVLLVGSALLVGIGWGRAFPGHVGGGTPGTATPLPTGSAQPTPEPSPSDTPPSDATATPTDQPRLSVAPLQIDLAACVAASAQFVVTNTGGGALKWSTTASNALYTLSPPGGSLTQGEQQTVTVGGITLSGQVTVDAPGAADAPQTVTITCA